MAARCRRVTMTDDHLFIHKSSGRQALPLALGYMHTIFVDEAVLSEPPGEEIGLRDHVCVTAACCHRRFYFAVMDVAVAPRSVDRCHGHSCLQSFQIDGRCAVKSVGNQQRPRCSPQEIMKTHGGVKIEVTHPLRRKYRVAGLTTQATEEMDFQEAKMIGAQSALRHFLELCRVSRQSTICHGR